MAPGYTPRTEDPLFHVPGGSHGLLNLSPAALSRFASLLNHSDAPAPL